MKEMEPVEPKNPISIKKYKEEYQNDEITAVLSIDGILDREIVTQTGDNVFYTNHNQRKEEDSNGCVFIDSRIDIHTTRKIILYGNSGENNIAFSLLKQYIDSYFLQEHPNITFITETEKELYQVFSVMILENDTFYQQLNFVDDEWVRHLTLMKEKSVYPIDYDATRNDKVLLLHTIDSDGKDIVIASVRIEIEEF